jgi:hypothetical protein
MIHHLARALHVRECAFVSAERHAAFHADRTPSAPAPGRPPSPIKPRPITPWSSPRQASAMASRVRISSDPSDVRRTVITGRFAEVCAALDRLVREQEATA